jgi:hypothetical protein
VTKFDADLKNVKINGKHNFRIALYPITIIPFLMNFWEEFKKTQKHKNSPGN